jgi:hypothetical protein
VLYAAAGAGHTDARAVQGHEGELRVEGGGAGHLGVERGLGARMPGVGESGGRAPGGWEGGQGTWGLERGGAAGGGGRGGGAWGGGAPRQAETSGKPCKPENDRQQSTLQALTYTCTTTSPVAYLREPAVCCNAVACVRCGTASSPRQRSAVAEVMRTGFLTGWLHCRQRLPTTKIADKDCWTHL